MEKDITPEPEQMDEPSSEIEEDVASNNDEPTIDNLGKALEETNILWSGFKTYSNNPNTQVKFYFEDFQIHSNLTISGLGTDLLGDYKIEGKAKVGSDGIATATFIKRYVDHEENELTTSHVREKASNQIEGADSIIRYVGKLGDHSKMTGEWEITEGQGKGFKGSFELKSCGQDWVGKMTSDGKQKELKIHLIIDNEFVYAASNDSKADGFYLMKGDNNP